MKGLNCPLCGTAKVEFHSSSIVNTRLGFESVAIFSCPNSHSFLVPYKTLHCLGVAVPEAEEDVADGREAAGWRTRRFVARMQQQKALIAQCRETAARLRESISRSIAMRQDTQTRRPYGLPIQ